jgi:lysyl-tRNA synthetase class I
MGDWDKFQKIEVECPFCHRTQSTKVHPRIPRHVVDCKCHAVAEVFPGKAIDVAGIKNGGFTWKIEWECRQ